MDNKYKMTLLAFGGLALSACSTTQPPKTKIVDTRVVKLSNGSKIDVLTQNAINGDVIEDTNNSLNLVAKSDNAKVVALKTLQFAAVLLGGGSSQVNTFSKDQLKGTYVGSVQNRTMEYVNPELDKLLTSADIPSNVNKEIIIQPYKYKLLYEGLDTSDYTFLYSATIKSGDYYHTCSSSDLLSAERTRPISDWEKNNYELTQTVAKKIIAECFKTINSPAEKTKLIAALSSTGTAKSM